MNSEEVLNTGGLGPPSDHLQDTKGKKGPLFMVINNVRLHTTSYIYYRILGYFIEINYI